MAKQEHNTTKEDAQPPAKQELTRKYSKDKSKCLVTFWLPKEAAPEARCVTVAGTFNNWDPKLHMLEEVLPEVDLVLVMTVNPGFADSKGVAGGMDRLRTAIKQATN